MSYIVLARKYRSKTFDEVVGQSHVAQTLKRAIQTGRIAHAYLFCGTRGVGKTSMARILAKALNCQKSSAPTTEPCGQCTSCLAIARGEDMDVIEIDAASNTQVDKTREVIIENVQYRPAHSRFKVFIIDEVHMLSKASFNALLKTMEEPPEHVKFVLATTEPEKVPPTILSRCQRFDFRNISTREIAEHLEAICRAEKIQADEDALLLVARAGAGSMRDALSLLDRLLSIGEKQISVELVEQSLGMPRAQAIYELVQSIGAGDVKAVLEGADRLIARGLSPDTLVVSLADHLRNLLILRTCGPDSQLVEVPGIAIEELTAQAERFEPMVLTQDIAILEELRRNLRTSQAGRALLDATLVRLALADQFTSVQELLGRMEASEPAAAAVGQKKKFEPALSQDQIPSQPADLTPGQQQIAPQAAADSGSDDEDDDALPAVGKVWNPSGPSLSELLRQQQ
ncbi:MAG TPA: DNA polymerase III subunit gamma/tau, partial [Tepidisphaeraceae bacterium]|nr:DNA polymerase III subunit gamma/tau [Tepidisphaeraceae bacterium]